MVFEDVLEGMPLRTGDIIATVDGEASLYGQLFRHIGTLIPGEPDHLAVYVGPHGICVEAGPKGVITFLLRHGQWDVARLFETRGILDTLYGVGDFITGRAEDESSARETVGRYVLDQVGKPYDFAFRNTENCFYCSQLVFRAAQEAGITLDLTRGPDHPFLPPDIITPEAVWLSCAGCLMVDKE